MSQNSCCYEWNVYTWSRVCLCVHVCMFMGKEGLCVCVVTVCMHVSVCVCVCLRVSEHMLAYSDSKAHGMKHWQRLWPHFCLLTASLK